MRLTRWIAPAALALCSGQFDVSGLGDGAYTFTVEAADPPSRPHWEGDEPEHSRRIAGLARTARRPFP